MLIESAFARRAGRGIQTPLNSTAFLSKDQNYGYNPTDRPDILFQLLEPHDSHNERPNGYVMDGDRVCLDPYLDGIPRCIRELARCLSWESKGGTEERSKYLLSITPEDCRKPEINSTKSIPVDLNEQQRNELAAVSWDQHQNKGLKNRGAESLESEQDSNLPRSYPPNSHLHQNLARINAFSNLQVSVHTSSPIVEFTQIVANSAIQIPQKRTIQKASYTLDLYYQKSNQDVALTSRKAKMDKARASPKVKHAMTSSEKREERFAKRNVRIEMGGSQARPEVFEDSGVTKSSSSLSELSDFSQFSEISELLGIAQALEANEDSEPEEPVTGVAALYVADNIDDTDPFYEAGFQAETNAVLAQNHDYRFVTPNAKTTAKRDRAHIRRALELTAIDFCDRRGHALPQEFLTEYTNESYISQQRRIQKEFNRVWSGMLPASKLYCLPAWHTEFRSWKVSAGKGQQCMNKLLAAEKLSQTLTRHSS